MWSFLTHLFDGSDFVPRWQCGQWSAAHGWLHIVSDTAIFAAYTAIPLVIAYFLLRKKNIPFPPIAWLFAAFILVCGIGHLIEASIFWHPWYRLSGLAKLITAIVSWATVIALVPIAPRALMMRSPEELEREISQRKQAEERYQLVVESSPHAFFEVNDQGRIVLVNSQAENWFGYTRAELLGQPVEMLVPERLRDNHVAHRSQYLAQPEPRSMSGRRDLCGRRKDGSEFPVEIGLSPVWWDDRLSVLTAVVDVTARTRAEEQLKLANAELERSNAELQHFAYATSHDLQEPLRAIAGYVQLLQRDYEAKLDETADVYIQHAVDGAKRMQTLIDDLLQYSRVGTRGKPYQTTDCNEVFDEIVRNLDAAIRESGGTVTNQGLPTIAADHSQLILLFQNLVANAIKFRGEQPPHVSVSAEKQDDEWLFSIRDNGIGFDASERDRVFLVFQRLHGRSQYPGSGMGLAICKRIVERHRGHIWADSTPGKGSVFYFALPAKQPLG